MSADERDVPVEFAEGFFHEARNAVFGLSVTLDALEEGADPGAALVQQVRTLASLSDRTARLMHDLVAYVEAPSGPLLSGPLLAILEQGLSEARERLGSRGLEVTGLDQVTGDVDADSPALSRALCSVLQGVAIVLPTPEPLRVAVAREADGSTEVRILASGGEVAAERIVTFFEPFAIRGSRITGFAIALARRCFAAHHIRVLLVRNGAEGLTLALTFPAR
jgi:signal transduction histidine kinase